MQFVCTWVTHDICPVQIMHFPVCNITSILSSFPPMANGHCIPLTRIYSQLGYLVNCLENFQGEFEFHELFECLHTRLPCVHESVAYHFEILTFPFVEWLVSGLTKGDKTPIKPLSSASFFFVPPALHQRVSFMLWSQLWPLHSEKIKISLQL